MVHFKLPEPLAERLLDWAKQEHRSPDEVLESVFALYQANHAAVERAADNPLLQIALAAQENPQAFENNDIAAHSRDILS